MRQEFILPGDNGYDISCLEWTCEQEKAALICLHGFAGDKYSSVIEALAETMSKDGFRVITFDWPGHGSSPAGSSCLTVENCLWDLDSVIRYIGNENRPICLFATSFGGFLGLNYLRRSPAVFSRIVLRSPALNMPDTFRSLLSPEELRRIENGEKINKGFDRPLMVDKSFYEDLQDYRIADFSVPNTVPGLMIQGDLDKVVDPQNSIDFARRNSWELHIIEGADHRYKKPGNLEDIISAAETFLLRQL